MAAQRAIVSSDQGGMPELIHDGENANGLLARNGDTDAYMLSLERLIEDSGLRERLGSSARKTVEQRHRDTHTGMLSANFYRDFLNHGSTGDLLETKAIDKPAFKDSVET